MKRSDPEKKIKIVKICAHCELNHIQKSLQDKLHNKKKKREEIIHQIQEKISQTEEKLRNKKQLISMIETQVIKNTLKIFKKKKNHCRYKKTLKVH